MSGIFFCAPALARVYYQPLNNSPFSDVFFFSTPGDTLSKNETAAKSNFLSRITHKKERKNASVANERNPIFWNGNGDDAHFGDFGISGDGSFRGR
jgi:hypothetical protein